MLFKSNTCKNDNKSTLVSFLYFLQASKECDQDHTGSQMHLIDNGRETQDKVCDLLNYCLITSL